MSVTKYIACMTCKKYLWVGQNVRLYDSPEHINALTKFLLWHHNTSRGERHNLLSLDEHEFGDGLLDGLEETSIKDITTT